MESWIVAKSPSQSADFGQLKLTNLAENHIVHDGHRIRFAASDCDSIQSEDRACLFFGGAEFRTDIVFLSFVIFMQSSCNVFQPQV